MSTLYWIIILGNLNRFAEVLLVILLIIAGCTGLFAMINDQDEDEDEVVKKASNIAKKSLLCSIIPILIVVFIPSTE